MLVDPESVPDGPNGQCCGGCRFFVRSYRRKSDLTNPVEQEGQCRFNPPVVAAFDETWPRVHETSWCRMFTEATA